MTTLTLGAAARLVGLSRATLSRGIRAGALVAGRDGDWIYRIDPDDLARFVLNRQIRELSPAAHDRRRDDSAAADGTLPIASSPLAVSRGLATTVGAVLSRLFRQGAPATRPIGQ